MKTNNNTGITAEIIADSLNPNGNRLTTFILQYPRFCHAEVMTHRMFSKNAASSRAIPTEKIIQAILDDPAMPVYWGQTKVECRLRPSWMMLKKNLVR